MQQEEVMMYVCYVTYEAGDGEWLYHNIPFTQTYGGKLFSHIAPSDCDTSLCFWLGAEADTDAN